MEETHLTYFKQLDGFRFLAVLAVMIFHYLALPFIEAIPLGFGVLFFFVLSSFLITRILLVAKVKNENTGEGHLFSLGQFYLRRSLRIFPAYYSLILFLIVINFKPAREIIISLLTYTINFKIGSGYDVGPYMHLWSLAIEEQFYLLFPFFVFFVNSNYLLRAFVFVALVGVLGRAGLYLYNSENIYFSNFHFLSALDSLGLGAILAYLSIYQPSFLKQLISRRWLFFTSFVIFFIVMLFTYTIPIGTDRFKFGTVVVLRFLFNLFSFWVLGWAVMIGYKGWLKLFLENKFVVYLGRISYGIYLYHNFIPRFLAHFFIKYDVNYFKGGGVEAKIALSFIYILVTVGAASLSWYIVEKPCNSLKKRFEYNRRRTATESVTS